MPEARIQVRLNLQRDNSVEMAAVKDGRGKVIKTSAVVRSVRRGGGWLAMPVVDVPVNSGAERKREKGENEQRADTGREDAPEEALEDVAHTVLKIPGERYACRIVKLMQGMKEEEYRWRKETQLRRPTAAAPSPSGSCSTAARLLLQAATGHCQPLQQTPVHGSSRVEPCLFECYTISPLVPGYDVTRTQRGKGVTHSQTGPGSQPAHMMGQLSAVHTSAMLRAAM